MLNSDDFIKRLEQLLGQHGLTAASFSDRIGVQRSSISHLLSGRNRPSLDFVLKIMEAFPETDLYWLLTGSETETRRPSFEKTTSQEKASDIEKILIFYSDGTFSEHKPK